MVANVLVALSDPSYMKKAVRVCSSLGEITKKKKRKALLVVKLSDVPAGKAILYFGYTLGSVARRIEKIKKHKKHKPPR